MEHPAAPEEKQPQDATAPPVQQPQCYTIQFRPGEQIHSAVSRIQNLQADEVGMAQTDHGLEPARIRTGNHPCPCKENMEQLGSFVLVRRGTREEIEKYERLVEREQKAFDTCQQYIDKHRLPMKLVKVERFFNGSKIIFYFTAESRVDFRELVKDLVQEFRTRVEIRQIGVRHETKMLGGLGCCGRELCCSSFIKSFSPVSIKMAKTQGLPLNPAKISGICNRLLCCLTYEFETYHTIRKKMPKPGKTIALDGQAYKVLKNKILEETIEVVEQGEPGKPMVWERSQWEKATPAKPVKNRPEGATKEGPAKQRGRAPRGRGKK